MWMITGDKPNTAISIGRSTGIIDAQTKEKNIFMLDRTEQLHEAPAILAFFDACKREVQANRISI